MDHLVSSDGAHVSPGHLPSHAEGRAVYGLQLDVQRRTEPIWGRHNKKGGTESVNKFNKTQLHRGVVFTPASV